MSINVCVITPTIGRPTLRQTLTSALLTSSDQWLVVGDGPQPQAAALVKELRDQGLDYLEYLELDPPGGRYGHPARDLAMTRAKADYLLFLDDDDIFAPHTWPTIVYELGLYWAQPVIFRMVNGNGEVLWKDPVLTVGNVGGSMVALPNRPHLPFWASTSDRHGCDLEFIQAALGRYHPSEIRWSAQILVICRPGVLHE